MVEYPFQRFVQVVVLIRTGKDITEQFRRQDEKALYLYQILTGRLCIGVGHLGIIKVLVPGGVFAFVDIGSEVLRNVAVEHRAEHIRFEIPLRHMTCMNKVGCDFIDAAEQLVPLMNKDRTDKCCSETDVKRKRER